MATDGVEENISLIASSILPASILAFMRAEIGSTGEVLEALRKLAYFDAARFAGAVNSAARLSDSGIGNSGFLFAIVYL